MSFPYCIINVSNISFNVRVENYRPLQNERYNNPNNIAFFKANLFKGIKKNGEYFSYKTPMKNLLYGVYWILGK
jgi:hypothetical protein